VNATAVEAPPVARLVPQIARNGTVVCLAPGPSLTVADVEAVRGRAVVVAINDAVQIAPWADVFYSSARVYWTPKDPRSRAVAAFAGLKVHVCVDQDKPGVGEDGFVRLRNTGVDGLEADPGGLKTYQNSGGAAINLAVHLGASRIVLLGYDMGPSGDGRHHFHEIVKTRHSSPYPYFRQRIATMVKPLEARGIEVLNCTRQTHLSCFPCADLATVFP
jgi:hypothetical protein